MASNLSLELAREGLGTPRPYTVRGTNEVAWSLLYPAPSSLLGTPRYSTRPAPYSACYTGPTPALLAALTRRLVELPVSGTASHRKGINLSSKKRMSRNQPECHTESTRTVHTGCTPRAVHHGQYQHRVHQHREH